MCAPSLVFALFISSIRGFATALHYTPSAEDLAMVSSDWPLYASTFCGRVCRNGTLVMTPNICTVPSCFQCDCDQDCALKGTCCPSVDTNSGKGSYDMPKTDPESYLNEIYNRIACWRPRFDIWYIYNPLPMVVKCPDDWYQLDTLLKCEYPSEDSLDTFLLYADYNSGLVFSNIHCVLCHGLDPYSELDSNSTNNVYTTSGLQVLPLTIRCDDPNRLMHFTDLFDLFMFAKENGNMCLISFYNRDIAIRNCTHPVDIPSRSELPSCSNDANNILRQLCFDLPDILGLRVSHFKNIFCKLCSEDNGLYREKDCNEHDYINEDDFRFYHSPDITVSKYDPHREVVDKHMCLSYHSRDYKDECRSITCPAGKLLSDGDHCTTAVSDIRGLRYRLDMIFALIEVAPELLFKKGFIVFNGISLFEDENFFHVYRFIEKNCTLESGGIQYKQEIDLVVILHATLLLNRDNFEDKMIQIVTNSSWNIAVPDTEQNSQVIKLGVLCLGKEQCDIYRSYSKENDNCVLASEKLVKSVFWPIETEGVDVTPSLVCPSVSFNLASQPYVENGTIIFPISVGNQEISYKNDGNISIKNGNVHLCTRAVYDLSRLLEEKTNQSNVHYSAKYDINVLIAKSNDYLFLVFITVSCALLLLSILTYTIFPSLLSILGLNTLCLCLSLLTAQLSLLVTCYFGVRGLLLDLHCLVHGVILHYSWLSSLMWMNSCCIHMYFTLTGRKLMHGNWPFLSYCLYSFGLPCAIIALVIFITTATSRYSIGYDKNTCFLDWKTSVWIIVLGLLVPLGFSVGTNIILFILSIKRIVPVAPISSQQICFHGVIACFLISIVSGTFCVLAMAAVYYNNFILASISHLFLGLQGMLVFIFLFADKQIVTECTNLILHITKRCKSRKT